MKRIFKFLSSKNYGAKWYPDAEYMSQYSGPVMYPTEESKTWSVQPWNYKKAPTEKAVKNVTLNFGPQHPAAHGVLRLVLELDGEVKLNPLNAPRELQESISDCQAS